MFYAHLRELGQAPMRTEDALTFNGTLLQLSGYCQGTLSDVHVPDTYEALNT